MERDRELLKLNGRNRGTTDIKCKFLKVDSPIAKYDSLGKLSCIICRIQIKTNVWKVHLNSKLHKQNVELAKRQRVDINGLDTLSKTISEETPQKALSALKSTAHVDIKMPAENSDDTVEIQSSTLQVLPEKFFDQEKSVTTIGSDRDLDTEWLKFQREIREAATISNNIVSEEQDNLNNKRHLKEIDEQIENWKRFIKINERKNFIFKKHRKKIPLASDVESMSEEEGSVDDLLDWRIKSVHK